MVCSGLNKYRHRKYNNVKKQVFLNRDFDAPVENPINLKGPDLSHTKKLMDRCGPVSAYKACGACVASCLCGDGTTGTKMNRSGAILAGRSSSPTSYLHLTQKSSLSPDFGPSGMSRKASRSFHARDCQKQHHRLSSTFMTACLSSSSRRTSRLGWMRKHMDRLSRRSSRTHI